MQRICPKDVRERLRSERPLLYKDFHVERLVSYKDDGEFITVIVEFRKFCPQDKKVGLAGYLEGVLGKKVLVIIPPAVQKDTEGKSDRNT